MSKGRVLIAAPVHDVLLHSLETAGYELVRAEKITQAIGNDLIKDCVGVVTSTRLQLDKALLDAAPDLKWIGRMGSGMEVIDVPYATSRGISCFSSPEGNSNAVGEHALGMLLSVTKKIAASFMEVKEGKWRREANRGIELEGKTVGIIGYGHTGQAFARKLAGFDVRILAYDKYAPAANGLSVSNASLDEVFQQADIISFHVPLQKDTYHYFDDEFIRKMVKPFILINTSRGDVVDTRALQSGLKAGKIVGAALDVMEQEPLEKMGNEIRSILSDIVQMPGVLVTPHVAGYSYEALYKMSKILSDKIVTHE